MMCSSSLSSGHLRCSWSNSFTVSSRLCGGPAGLLKAGLVFVHIRSVVVGNPLIMEGNSQIRSLIIIRCELASWSAASYFFHRIEVASSVSLNSGGLVG